MQFGAAYDLKKNGFDLFLLRFLLASFNLRLFFGRSGLSPSVPPVELLDGKAVVLLGTELAVAVFHLLGCRRDPARRMGCPLSGEKRPQLFGRET